MREDERRRLQAMDLDPRVLRDLIEVREQMELNLKRLRELERMVSVITREKK